MDSQLTVAKFFAGTNYLEAVSGNRIEDLINIDTLGDMNKATPESIFNKFSTFSYSNFVDGAKYNPAGHFIGFEAKDNPYPASAQEANEKVRIKNRTDAAAKLDSNNPAQAREKLRLRGSADNIEKSLQSTKAYAESYRVRNNTKVGNPTATNIINWANTESPHSITGFQPYAMTDFAFCKNYGKVPNNRLITLRRYPFPIDDRIGFPNKPHLIPVAQAITWWGSDTGNELSKLGVMNWSLKWETITVQQQDIDGNEVLVRDFVDLFKKSKDSKAQAVGELLEKAAIAQAGKDATPAAAQQVSGMDAKMTQYVKDLYDPSKGPYWNRIFGPVNVIHQSTRRIRGMQDGWDTPFTVNFHYSFRSFNGLSPKIVALDLISNFLRLTYNDAQFLGQLGRYFARPGLKFSPTITELLGNILTKWATTFDGGTQADMMKLVGTVYNALTAAGNEATALARDIAVGKTDKAATAGLNIAQAFATKAMSSIIPDLISVKSALSDRPIGEWHLVVGNPMNPIMTMGDLVCTNCSMKFDEEMGPDDFPTGITFAVALRQGKPRDKVAIERMFNLGAGPLMKSALGNPSSDNDTFDTVNNQNYETSKKGNITDKDRQAAIEAIGTETFNRYRNRIRNAYGYSRGTDASTKLPKVTVDDSLLWLYFGRKQDSQ
jgi:hypothetical protein